jgi:hypothetical protein
MKSIFHPRRFIDAMNSGELGRTVENFVEDKIQHAKIDPKVSSLMSPSFQLLEAADTASTLILEEEKDGGLTDQADAVEYSVNRFIEAGSNIFDLSGVAAALKHTDIADDLDTTDLKLPFKAFYIHIGNVGLATPYDGQHVEGFYIEDLRGDRYGNVFSIVAVCNESANSKNEFDHYVEFSRSVEVQISNEGTLNDAIKEAEKEAYSSTTVKWGQAIRPAIKVAVATMCYLAALGAEIKEDWPEAAPRDLVQDTKSLRGRTSRHAEVKLKKMGFTKVKVPPRSAVKTHEIEHAAENDSVGEWIAKRSHWRRGHIRRQAHGPNHSLRKIVWIEPTLVSADSEPDIEGHVYEPPKLNS